MLTSMRAIPAVFVFTVLASVAVADGTTSPIFRNLNPPANEYIINPRDINNRGFIVGEVYDRNARFAGFCMIDRMFAKIDPAPPEDVVGGSIASGIEDKGVVVGVGLPNEPIPQMWTYVDGVFTKLPPPAGVSGWAIGKINTRGYIVGSYGEDFPGYSVSHAVLFFKGTFTNVDFPSSRPNVLSTVPRDINERGAIVGTWGDFSPDACSEPSENPGCVLHGFIRSVEGRYTTFDVPNSRGTVPTGINNLGHIVGNYLDQDELPHGFLLVSGRFTRIDIPGSNTTEIAGINDSDEIVGSYSAPDVVNGHAFIANALSFRR